MRPGAERAPGIEFRVGMGSCGIANGARPVQQAVEQVVRRTGAGRVKSVGCGGMCYREPLVEIIDDSGTYLYGNIDEDKAVELIDHHINQHNPIRDYVVHTDLFKTLDNTFVGDQVKITLRNCGYIDPESIDEYEARNGYRAIKKIAGTCMSRLDVIQTVLDSVIRGRGGGGFPTGLKWKFANNNKSAEKYIICNADEGDPGAFMDRAVIEGDPHRLLEELGPEEAGRLLAWMLNEAVDDAPPLLDAWGEADAGVAILVAQDEARERRCGEIARFDFEQLAVDGLGLAALAVPLEEAPEQEAEGRGLAGFP